MAGGTGANRPGAIIEGINVTPLVDIMLVLLVIFIVTAKILVTPAIPMELPEAVKTDEMQVVFSVMLPAEGQTLVNGQPVPDDDALRAVTAEALAREPNLRAVIQADGSVPHRKVIAALDLLRRVGLVKVAFATQAPEVEPR